MQRESKFMIDIETTGVDFEADEILEIGILQLQKEDGYWIPKREFQTYVKSDKQPMSEFGKLHMKEVYEAANTAPTNDPQLIRSSILEFLSSCGVLGAGVSFIGNNASGFDLPFMHHSQFLRPPGYETINGQDRFVGDHHYRVYELSGALQLASDALSISRPDLLKLLENAFEMDIPEGKAHTALYDCYTQAKQLNGLIKLLRERQGLSSQ